MKVVFKEEFEKFLKDYPHKLECDYYMEWFSWNDFSTGCSWPKSVVAMKSDGSYNMPIKYKIADEKELENLFNHKPEKQEFLATRHDDNGGMIIDKINYCKLHIDENTVFTISWEDDEKS